jgi:hypothetical protein
MHLPQKLFSSFLYSLCSKHFPLQQIATCARISLEIQAEELGGLPVNCPYFCPILIKIRIYRRIRYNKKYNSNLPSGSGVDTV